MAVLKLEKDAVAYIFSYQQTRDSTLVKAGEYPILDIQYTSWGEKILVCGGLPPLIVATFWGPTPFMEAAKIEV